MAFIGTIIYAGVTYVAATASFYAATAAAVLGFSAGGIAAVGALAGAAVTVGAAYLGSEMLGSYLMPEINIPGSSSSPVSGMNYDAGILLNKQACDEKIPVVVGERRVGGTIVFLEEVEEEISTDQVRSHLHLVVVLSEGEVGSIETIYLNDIPSTDDRFSLRVYTYKHVGTDTQTADSNLVANVTRWTTNHRLRGLAYIYIHMVYDREVFYSGVPTITADVKGVKCYDTRTSTTIWTDNPAVILRNYLINTTYGRGIPSANIDDDAFEDAADYCDELVTVENIGQVDGAQSGSAAVDLKNVTARLLIGDVIKFDGHATEYTISSWSDGVDFLGETADATTTGDYKTFSTTTVTLDQTLTAAIADNEDVHKRQKRYTCNGIIHTQMSSLDIVKELLTSCRGMLVFSGGKYKLVIDKPASSTFSFTESNIVGQWSISMGSKTRQYNRVIASYYDPYQGWQKTTRAVDSTTYRTADNGLLLQTEINLPFTADTNAVEQITTINMKQSRQQVTAEFTATVAALEVEVGDVIDITHSTPAWSAKLFRVMRIALLNSDEVRLSVREYDATVYDYGTIEDYDPSPNTGLPDLLNAAAPSYISVVSTEILHDLTPQVQTRLKWPSTTYAEKYEIEYKKDSNSKTVTNITKSDPAIVTAAGHTFVDGDVVKITGGDMVEVADRRFTVYSCNQGAGTFFLRDEDSAGYTTYTTGATVDYDYSALGTVPDDGEDVIFYEPPAGLLEDGVSYTFRVRAYGPSKIPSAWTTDTGNTIITGDLDGPWLIVGPHTERGEYATIQAALDDLATQDYNGVYIRNGTYSSSSTITLPARDVNIMGESAAGVKLQGPTTNSLPLLTLTNSTTEYRYKIHNLSLVSRHTGAGHVIEIDGDGTPSDNASIVSLYNVNISCYGTSGFSVDHAVAAFDGVGGISLVECTIVNGAYGVYVDNYDALVVRNCTFNNQYAHINCINTTRFVAKDNVFKNARLYTLNTNIYTEDIIVTGNYFYSINATMESTLLWGVFIGGVSCVFCNNNLYFSHNSLSAGFTINLANLGGQNLACNSNVVYVETDDNVYVRGIRLATTVDSSISGNSIYIDASYATPSYNHSGIYCDPSNGVDRNTFSGNQINMVNNDSTYDVGIYIGTGDNYNHFADNITYNCGVAIDDNGTGNTTAGNQDY